MLATTGPPLWVRDPGWAAPHLLTPVTYREHRFYLYLEDELTVVLYQYATGEWRTIQTPVELAQLTADSPQRADRLRILQTQFVDVAVAPTEAAASAPAQALLLADPSAAGPVRGADAPPLA